MPLTISAPPGAVTRRSSAAASTTIGASRLARTMSNTSSIAASGVVLAATAPATPLRRALASVAVTAAGEMSIAATYGAPRRAATMPSTPLPQPTSSTVAPGHCTARNSRSDSTVVGWSPRPKAAPGSMSTRSTPGGVATSCHAGTMTRSASTHDGTAWARQLSATAGSSATVRHRQRCGNASAARVTASTSSPSDVHSSTKWSSVGSVSPSAGRSSIAATPSAHSASLASSVSLAGTVTTRASTGSVDPPQLAAVSGGPGDVLLDAARDLLHAGPIGLDGRRCADGEGARRHVDVVEDDGVGGDDGSGADDRAMQDDRPVGDHRPVLHDAPLEVDDVADHALVADDRRVVDGGVQHRAILDARAGADPDLTVVTAQHGVRPDRALRPDRDGTDDHRVRVDVGRGVDRWHLVAEGVDGHERDGTARPPQWRRREASLYGGAPMS